MSLVVPELARLEIKFVGPEIAHPHVIAWLKALPLAFRKTYQPRRVNNVYFDTCDLQAYEENLSGVSSRIKIRYRWYGLSPTPDIGVLEVKKRRNNFGWKERFSINEAPYKDSATWLDIINHIGNQVPDQGKHYLKQNKLPVMLNRYYREYFESADHKIRATIDTKQIVYDQRYKPTPNLQRQALNLPKWLVLEFKLDRQDRDLLTDHLNTCPIRTSRNSKYVNAVRSIFYY